MGERVYAQGSDRGHGEEGKGETVNAQGEQRGEREGKRRIYFMRGVYTPGTVIHGGRGYLS
jgi:hypothetical protein